MWYGSPRPVTFLDYRTSPQWGWAWCVISLGRVQPKIHAAHHGLGKVDRVVIDVNPREQVARDESQCSVSSASLLGQALQVGAMCLLSDALVANLSIPPWRVPLEKPNQV